MLKVSNNNQCTDFTVEISPIKEDAMTRYQFLNIKTFHLIIADAKEAAWRLGLNEGPVVIPLRDPRRRPNLRDSAAFKLTAATNRAPWRQVCDRAVVRAPRRSDGHTDR